MVPRGICPECGEPGILDTTSMDETHGLGVCQKCRDPQFCVVHLFAEDRYSKRLIGDGRDSIILDRSGIAPPTFERGGDEYTLRSQDGQSADYVRTI